MVSSFKSLRQKVWLCRMVLINYQNLVRVIKISVRNIEFSTHNVWVASILINDLSFGTILEFNYLLSLPRSFQCDLVRLSGSYWIQHRIKISLSQITIKISKMQWIWTISSEKLYSRLAVFGRQLTNRIPKGKPTR